MDKVMSQKSSALSMAALPRAARMALQWRLLLLWAAWMLVPTAIVALPVWHLLAENLDYSVHAAALARQLDMTAVSDLLAVQGKNQLALTQAGITALVATLLMSPLLSGMAVTAARAPASLGFAALMRGGVDEYARMLRMLAWAVVPLGVVLLAGTTLNDIAAGYAGRALVASDAALPGALAAAFTLLLSSLAYVTLDAGRAVLALNPRQTSVVLAWCAGCEMLARRPFATLGAYAAVSVVGLGLAGLLSLARLRVPGVDSIAFACGLLLTQAIVVTIGWMRCARLFALVALARPASVPGGA